MATRQGTVDAILDLVGPALPVTAKRMFGEYGLYLDGRMFALVCDDQLFSSHRRRRPPTSAR